MFRFVCQTLREHLAKTHELLHHHRLGITLASFSLLFLFYFFVFFIYLFIFWFDSLLVCVLVDLGIEFSYGDKDLVIFYLGLKGGFRSRHLQIYGYFLIWSLSQNGSNMVFLLVYAY